MKPLSEETRQDLTIAAAARERRNRPVGLVAASAVLLGVAALAALLAVGSRAAAAGSLRSAARSTDDVRARVSELEALRSASENPAHGTVGEPMRDIDVQAKLEQAAVELGLKEKAQSSRVIPTNKGKIRVVEYRYQNLRSENLEGMLKWVGAAGQTVQGLEVYGLELRWDATGVCTMTVTFRRWERAT